MGADLTEFSPGHFALDVAIKGGIVFTLQNLVKGVLPIAIASSWDTPPTNLANATDGNIDTVTGTGTSTGKGIYGNYGVISFDLGSVKNILVGGKVGLWATTGSSEIYVQASADNIHFYNTDFLLAEYGNIERIGWLSSVNVVCRYITFILTSNTNTTVNMKIYELMIYNLGTL